MVAFKTAGNETSGDIPRLGKRRARKSLIPPRFLRCLLRPHWYRWLAPWQYYLYFDEYGTSRISTTAYQRRERPQNLGSGTRKDSL